MPEGPTVKKWATMAGQFLGRKVLRTGGNTKRVDLQILQGLYFSDIQVHGKEMFMKFASDSSEQSSVQVWLRYHFGMWGTLRVNELKTISNSTLYRARYIQDPKPRLVLSFGEEEFLAFYGCSVQQVDAPLLDNENDVLRDSFNIEKSSSFLRQEKPVCHLLLDQRQFAGVGNIVKNEALYSARLHPMQLGSTLSSEKILELVEAAGNIAKKWAKDGTPYSPLAGLNIYCKKTCPLGHKVQREMLDHGEFTRITYWCSWCQPLQPTAPSTEFAEQVQVTETSGEKSPKTWLSEGSSKWPVVILKETSPGSNLYA
ncbi:PREDICTED: endonuclease 8-like 2 [Branchiostoma belcheri]|uniref:Endonuclease 8-like 2 n=1 Tax=Branchiostoma belcheri TaxID=7741 RepID=A0A6P4ZHN1_BRABE|nr:PREDICTED: endonuclease 8-like 2 [Branchiostoma belcheri]